MNIRHNIKLRIEIADVSKRQQPVQRAAHSQWLPMGLSTARKPRTRRRASAGS